VIYICDAKIGFIVYVGTCTYEFINRDVDAGKRGGGGGGCAAEAKQTQNGLVLRDHSQGYIDMQSLVRCLDHGKVVHQAIMPGFKKDWYAVGCSLAATSSLLEKRSF